MMPGMEFADHLEVLRHEGELLAAAATDLDRAVPACPGWTVRDLVRHTGGIHRWAAAHVRDRREQMMPQAEEDAVRSSFPAADDALLDWYADGHRSLVEALEQADPQAPVWSFLRGGPTGVAFWARRQAHETTIHRIDAGDLRTPIGTEFGLDGVDELLHGFFARKRRGRTDTPYSLHLHATDGPGEWLVRGGPDGVVTTDEHARADCAVRAPAADLYLLLWNRRHADGLEVYGDPAVLDLWRDSARVI